MGRHDAHSPTLAQLLDARAIDAELSHVLRRQWDAACSHFGTGLCLRFQPELHALLRAVMWYFSVGSGAPTAGEALLGLQRRLKPPMALGNVGMAIEPPASKPAPAGSFLLPRALRAADFILAVALPWAWARAARVASAPDHPERLRWCRLMRRLEAASHLLGLICSLRLLRGARQPSVAMALLGLQLVSTTYPAPRHADFDFMNQELAWRVVEDLVASFRPLSLSSAAQAQQDGGATAAAGPSMLRAFVDLVCLRRPQLTALVAPVDDLCALCNAQPIHTPTVAACGHRFCYFCLGAASLVDDSRANSTCPHCRAPLKLPSQAAITTTVSSRSSAAHK